MESAGANVAQILSTGLTGLTFLLAYLVYKLIERTPTDKHRLVYTFMALVVFAALLNASVQVFEVTRSKPTNPPSPNVASAM